MEQSLSTAEIQTTAGADKYEIVFSHVRKAQQESTYPTFTDSAQIEQAMRLMSLFEEPAPSQYVVVYEG